MIDPAVVVSPDVLVEAQNKALEAAGLPVAPAPVPMRRRPKFVMLLVADSVALGFSLIISQLLLHSSHASAAAPLEALAYLPLLLVVMACYGLYRRGARRLMMTSFPDLGQLVHALVVGNLLLLFVSGAANRWGLSNFDRRHALVTGGFALVLVPLCRWIGNRMAHHPKGRSSRVLIVGSGQVATSVMARLATIPHITVVGFVDDGAPAGTEPWTQVSTLGTLDQLFGIVASQNVDHIVVAFSPASGAKLAGLLRSLAESVQISIVPRLFDLLTVRSRVDDVNGMPLIDVAPASLGPADRLAKRAMDIVAAAVGLVVLSPVLLFVALAVKATSPGPVFFWQQRTGRRGRVFKICKFRSMRVNAESERHSLESETEGPLFKLKQDPRITSIGRILRLTSIDELPQLLNVLKGDMSLVGPRPFVTSESAEFAGWAARRFDVRPGMTGLWQVSGRSDLPFDELCRLDYSYVASWSLWWDMRILWHTPTMVFRRHGAY